MSAGSLLPRPSREKHPQVCSLASSFDILSSIHLHATTRKVTATYSRSWGSLYAEEFRKRLATRSSGQPPPQFAPALALETYPLLLVSNSQSRRLAVDGAFAFPNFGLHPRALLQNPM